MINNSTPFTVKDLQEATFCVHGQRRIWNSYYAIDTRPDKKDFHQFIKEGVTVGWMLAEDSPYKNDPYLAKTLKFMEEQLCQHIQ